MNKKILSRLISVKGRLLFIMFGLLCLAWHSSAIAVDQTFALLSRETISLYDVSLHQVVPSPHSLELQVNLPKGLKVKDHEIVWKIFSTQHDLLRQFQGNNHQVSLPAGSYQIQLQVGRFQQNKWVLLKGGWKVTPYFHADVGRLEALSSQPARWKLSSKKHRFELGLRRYIAELVPAGAYILEASVNQFPVQKRIFVNAGQQLNTSLAIPVARINLVAVQDNNPLFQQVQWQIFRLEGNKKQFVGSYQRHSRTIIVPPGRYEVVARHADKVRSRQFWVQTNTNNKIVLAMD